MALIQEDWIAPVRDLSCAVVGRALGMTVTDKAMGPCPVSTCGATQRSRSSKGHPIGFRRDAPSWKCHTCGTTGDGLDLVAWRLTNKAAAKMNREDSRAIRNWYTSNHWLESPPEAPAPKEPVRMTAAEVAATWDQLIPVTAPGHGHDLLASRGYDLAEIARMDLARQVPKNWQGTKHWPKNWSCFGLVVRLYDVRGVPAGIHGRATKPGIDVKCVSTKDYDVGGLYMMNPAAKAWPTAPDATYNGAAMATEGLTDYLRAATTVPQPDRTPVLGVVNGSWRTLSTYPWGSIERVYTPTDNDRAGREYAGRAVIALGTRNRPLTFPVGDYSDAIKSTNDLADAINQQAPPEDRLHFALLRLERAKPKDRPNLLRAAMADPNFIQAIGEVSLDESRWDKAVARIDALNINKALVETILEAASAERLRLNAEQAWGSAGVIDNTHETVQQALGALLDGHDLPQLVVPDGWVLSPHGIFKLKREEDGQTSLLRRAMAPILITGLTRNLQTDQTELIVEWPLFEGGQARWIRRSLARADVLDNRKLLGLANFGAPVNGGNASAMVNWLAEFESANQDTLPLARTTRRTGWQPGNVFLLGNQLITKDAVHVADHSLPTLEWPKHYVTFQGDAGTQQVLGAYRPSGTFEGWRDVVRAVMDRPIMVLGIWASFIPPLLDLIPSMPPFCLDVSGKTSRGKTTGLRVFASPWGNPNERSVPSAIHSWDATPVWIERIIGALGGVPFILDDTKRAKPQDVQRILYDVTAGQGRGRGTITGTAEKTSHKTLLIQTGEMPATEIGHTGHGGASARVLEVEGVPLGEASGPNAQLAMTLSQGLNVHHGTAGVLYVQKLIQGGPGLKKELQNRYLVLSNAAVRAAGANPVKLRASAYVAALQLAGELVERWLDLAPVACDPLALAWTAAGRASEQADLGRRAMEFVLGWAASMEDRFIRAGTSTRLPPSQGWCGKWEQSATTWTRLAIIGSVLKPVLERAGFHYGEVLGQWEEEGWITTATRGSTVRRTVSVRLGASCPRCVQIEQDKLPPDLLGDDD